MLSLRLLSGDGIVEADVFLQTRLVFAGADSIFVDVLPIRLLSGDGIFVAYVLRAL